MSIPKKNINKQPRKIDQQRLKKVDGQFILMNMAAFYDWLNNQGLKRSVKLIQNHHTWIPNYSHFKGDDHFKDLQGMKRSHMKRGFSDIAQNITIFPDGLIAVCRPINTAPAGIKGANSHGICIENYGNFDIDGDEMSEEQERSILFVNAALCEVYKLEPNTDTVVYHHWWTAGGKRTNGVKAAKSCPGTNFFGGNKVEDAEENFIPKIKSAMALLIQYK